MTLATLKTKANARLADFWTVLVSKQDTYYTKHGKYFSLMATQRVVDGADTTFELNHPHDEKHSADVTIDFNSPVPFQIRVDEWSGVTPGYTAIALVELPNGDQYIRSRDNSNNDSGWSKKEPDISPNFSL